MVTRWKIKDPRWALQVNDELLFTNPSGEVVLRETRGDARDFAKKLKQIYSSAKLTPVKVVVQYRRAD